LRDLSVLDFNINDVNLTFYLDFGLTKKLMPLGYLDLGGTRRLHQDGGFLLSINQGNIGIFYSLSNESYVLNDDYILYYRYKVAADQRLFKLAGSLWFFYVVCADSLMDKIYIRRFMKNTNFIEDDAQSEGILDLTVGFGEQFLGFEVVSPNILIVLWPAKA
jgi:hypothetical protein